MDKKEMINKISAGELAENNGKVLRVINMSGWQFIKLSSLRHALPFMTDAEILKSMDYLHEAGYIKLRTTDSHENVLAADAEFYNLEAKLTNKGDQMLGGCIPDPLVYN